MIPRRLVLIIGYAIIASTGLWLVDERQKTVRRYVRDRTFPLVGTTLWTIDPSLIAPVARETFPTNHLLRAGDCVPPNSVPAVMRAMPKETCTGKYAARELPKDKPVDKGALAEFPTFSKPGTHALAGIPFSSPLIAATLGPGGVAKIHYANGEPLSLEVQALLCNPPGSACTAMVAVDHQDLVRFQEEPRRFVTFMRSR